MKVESVLLIFLGAFVAQSVNLSEEKAHLGCTEEEKIYWENVAEINKHNSNPNRTYDQGINQFTNLTVEQLEPIINGILDECDAADLANKDENDNNEIEAIRVKRDDEEIPEAFTYIGYFGEAKNQGLYCASCWAFSSVGLLEYRAHSDGNVIFFSEQDVLDCSRGGDCRRGGYMKKALDYIIKNGIASEKDYPYVAKQGKCMHKNFTEYSPKLRYSLYKPRGDEAFMRKKLYENGPFIGTLDIKSDPRSLVAYKSGVYSSYKCTRRHFYSHAIVVVGYGVHPRDGPYWTVRNSWGKEWGIDGYFRIARGVNMCGIEEQMYQ